MTGESAVTRAERHAKPSNLGRHLPWVAATVTVVGLGFGVWYAGGDANQAVGVAAAPVETVARTRALSPANACLLTDPSGVGRAPASLVWKGMSRAAGSAKARVSFVPVPNVKLAGPMLNAAMAQRCTVIAAVGGPQIAAVNAAERAKHPGIKFAVAQTSGATAGVTGFAPTEAAAYAAVGKLLAETGNQ